MSDQTEIVIDEAWLHRNGTNSLLGQIANINKDRPLLGYDKPVVLVFPQATPPGSLTVPDYAIACLMEDVLALKALGTDVRVRS